MPQPDRPDTAKFLISAKDDAPLNDVLATLADDPDVDIVDTIGPRDQPHTAVVEIKAVKAQAWARRLLAHNQQLIIEPDQPLSPLG